jgi:hypothetical protein
MKEYPFNTAYTQARELYDLTLNPDQFETIGLIAWDKIGNKRVRLYKYQAEPQQTEAGDWFIELPCNADILEAVTTDYEDYQKTTPTTVAGDHRNGWVESYVESRKFNTSFGYVSGKFVKYFRKDNTLFLSDEFEKINVFYKGVLVDDEGLPSLNEKELDAIAVFCAYSEMFKQGLRTKDQSTIQLSQILKAE